MGGPSSPIWEMAGTPSPPAAVSGWKSLSGTASRNPRFTLFPCSCPPTGAETFDLRKQLAVQAIPDGRGFALFALDIPQDLMGHPDILLECGSGQTVTETLNVTAALE